MRIIECRLSRRPAGTEVGQIQGENVSTLWRHDTTILINTCFMTNICHESREVTKIGGYSIANAQFDDKN